jgi:hypothetical protein
MRRPAHSLDEDLDALFVFFNPIATGRRLRDLLADLPAVPSVRSGLLRPPIVIGDEDDFLITPEGRVVFSVLTILLDQEQGSIMIDPDVVFNAERRVYERYRRWGLQRLDSVLRLRSGKAQTIALPSLGWLLLLLVNGSRSRDTAVRRLADRAAPRELDNAIAAVVAAFNAVLDPGTKLDPRQCSLYGGFVPTEARRRLPGALGPEQEYNYILPEGEDRVFTLIAAELSRPQRSPPTARVLEAFDRLVDTYRRELPTFAALDQAHERRLETHRIRQRLEDSLGED